MGRETYTMICREVTKEIRSQVDTAFECDVDGNRVVIYTPFRRPDGDSIVVYVTLKNSEYVVSDLGETFMYLAVMDADVSRSKRRQKIVNEIAKRNKVNIDNGAIVARVSNIKEVPDAIYRVTNASVEIHQLVHTTKPYYKINFEERVEEFLVELKEEHPDIDYETDYTVTGISNRPYTIDFHVFNGKQALIQTASTENPGYVRQLIERLVTMWTDIEDVERGVDFITVIDDEEGKKQYWVDYTRLLSKKSKVVFWSSKEDLEKILLPEN